MQIVKGLFLMLGLFVFSNAVSAQTSAAIITNVSVDDFKKMNLDDITILDVRTPGEVQQGAIPGAININLFGDFMNEINKLDKSKTYLVYCRSGHRSAQAANKMASAGFAKIYNLLGGYNQWSRSK